MIKPRGFSLLTAEGAAMKRLLVCLLLVGVVGCGLQKESSEQLPGKTGDQGNPLEMMSEANKAIQLAPNNPDVYFDRGMLLVALGQHEKGIADFNRAIELNPKNSKYYAARGVAYEELGDEEKAYADMAMVEKINLERYESGRDP